MLSIAKLTSSGAAVSYFEKEDYYHQDRDNAADSAGAWWGVGSEKLGLEGVVDRDQFKQVLDGHLPDGTHLGTVRTKGGEKVHQPGWDLTFSAPKSVSVLSEVGGDERLRQAHDEAVKETLGWMESNIAGYRRKDFLGTTQTPAGRMVVALFEHHTSRDQDPQLHTHAVVANAVLADDGRWKSLNSEPFFRHKMAGGNIYRAALARRVQELGYSVERTHLDGRFEITAVPENALQAFAARSQEIRAAMQERGLEGAVDAERAALMTRAKKVNAPLSELVDRWLEKTDSLDFDVRAAVASARVAGDKTPTGPAPTPRAVTEAISRLSDNESVFTHADMLRWGLAGAMGRASVADVETAIQKAREDKSLISVPLGGARAWTTPMARHQERLILESMQSGKGAVKPALTREQAEKGLAGSSLNEGQRAAAELILTSPARYTGVLGRPGVGKTYMLKEIKPLLEAAGYRVKGMAANAEAARTIQQDSGIESTTLQRQLRAAEKDLAVLTRGDPLSAAAVRQRAEKEVWVLDEASQVSAKLMRRTMHLADRLGVRVVAIGDVKQLSSIEAGKPFEQLLKAGMKYAEMDDIRRQKSETHKKAIRQVIAGDVRGAMTTLKSETHEIENREKRLAAIVRDWAASGAAREHTAVLTARNAERIVLNEAMRDVLRKEGRLQGELPATALQKVFAQRMDKVEVETYKTGDVLLFGRGVDRLGIEAGRYMRVQSVDRRNNEVVLQAADGAGPQVAWNPRSVAGGARQGVELFRERQTSLAPGERIQWGLNVKSLKLSDDTPLTNGQMLTVRSYDGKHLELVSAAGASVRLDAAELASKHWDHARAMTIFKSQGRTEDRVLVNAEANQTELLNQKAFLVAISRQREQISLYTDDTKRFTENVDKRLGDKTTVEGANDERRLDLLREQMRALYDSVGPRSRGGRDDNPAQVANDLLRR